MADKKFKNKYRIPSARLKNYDYSTNGAYFITICTKNQEHYFGNIIDKRMKLNDVGGVLQKYWHKIPEIFPFIKLDEFIIMPNHIHCILWIDKNIKTDYVDVARDGGVVYVDDGDAGGGGKGDAGGGRDAINRVSTETPTNKNINKTGGITGKTNPMFHNNISRVLRWYKGRCTFEINKMNREIKFAWQSRFYDHIIRNEKSLHHIRQYIINNPKKWYHDRNNTTGLWL